MAKRDYDSSPEPSADGSAPKHSPKSNPLKITLRAGPAASPTVPPPAPSSDREDLTPPPALKLKLRTTLADKVERAQYSSDEEEPKKEEEKKRPAKKARTSKSAPHSYTSQGPLLPAQHRKTYEWLQPGTASASHTGPPVRKRDEKKEVDKEEPVPIEEVPLAEEVPREVKEMEDKPKKSHKKKAGDPPGPGKSWRKGIKKGVAKTEDGMMSLPATPPMEASSRAPSEEPEPLIIETIFEKADAAALGFPVFAKPIVPPKIALGVFPRVTTSFSAPNGGDTGPFPRREKVRNWDGEEHTLVGIGGGTLRFHSWRRGPQSELGLILEAERAAKDAQAKAKKDNSERPLLTTTNSFESRDPDAKSVDENESEMGDEDEPKSKKRKVVKGRKSKLAQEILPKEEAPQEGE